MIETALQFIQEYLIPLGAVGVFFAAVLEEVIAPIPSALVILASGFLFVQGDFSILLLRDMLFIVVIPISLGVTIGSLFPYYIAYTFGKPALLKWGKWFGITWSDMENAEKKFSRGVADEFVLFGLRIVPIVPSVAISLFCGLIRLSLKKYLPITFLGTLVKATALAVIGWQVGEFYHIYAEFIDGIEIWGLGLIILAIIGAIVFRIWKKRKV